MKQAVQPFRRFKFGVFEADLRTGELTKLGKRVRLQEQPFQLLAVLLEKPGELVIREELRERLWPKTHRRQPGLPVSRRRRGCQGRAAGNGAR